MWNVAYDTILQKGAYRGCQLICYADNTLLIAKGKNKEETVHAAEKGTNFLVKRIKKTGLQVALDETKVVIFEGANGERKSQLNMEGKVILPRSFIRYPWHFCR